MQGLTRDGKSKMMSKWLDFAETKGSRNEELQMEMGRIKTIDVRIEKQILDKKQRLLLTLLVLGFLFQFPQSLCLFGYLVRRKTF